jgi:hypothetical protein
MMHYASVEVCKLVLCVRTVSIGIRWSFNDVLLMVPPPVGVASCL